MKDPKCESDRIEIAFIVTMMLGGKKKKKNDYKNILQPQNIMDEMNNKVREVYLTYRPCQK